jgi:RNA-binding protein
MSKNILITFYFYIFDMKLVHNIEMRVFVKPEDNEENIIKTIKQLFPFDFKKEKIEFISKMIDTFDSRRVKSLTVFTNKERHNKVILKNIFSKLNEEQKELLLRQLESRLDESLHFYIRFDKDKLILDNYHIIDSGHCFWFKFCIASYPHKREIAINVVKKMLEL